MAKKKRATHQPFESKSEHGQFTKICLDMMGSPAWEALNLRQQGLYIRLKSKYRQKVERGIMISSNRDDVSIPASEWEQLYGNYKTFRADMDKLIELGFIRLVASGRTTRTPNIYGFVEGWKNWKEPKDAPVKRKA